LFLSTFEKSTFEKSTFEKSGAKRGFLSPRVEQNRFYPRSYEKASKIAFIHEVMKKRAKSTFKCGLKFFAI
jgi:hypothetical protein